MTTDKPSPQSGDVLLGCVHRPNPYAAHIFLIPNGLPFTRPDGTTATAQWIVLCDRCHTLYVVQRGGLASDAPIGCDSTWQDDDEPIQYKEPS
jgi:hypothetical protein